MKPGEPGTSRLAVLVEQGVHPVAHRVLVAAGVVPHGKEAAVLDHAEQLGHVVSSLLPDHRVSAKQKARTELSVRAFMMSDQP